MSLCITGLSTQDPHNQMEHTEFYEKYYGNVKYIEKNLSQKNYMETENYKLWNLKQKDSRVEKIKIISFLSYFNSHQIVLTFLRFQAVRQLHWSVLSHRQTYIAQCKCDKITICRFVSDNVVKIQTFNSKYSNNIVVTVVTDKPEETFILDYWYEINYRRSFQTMFMC